MADGPKLEGEEEPGFYTVMMQHGPAWGDDPEHPETVNVKSEPYEVDGKTYKYTEGSYSFGLNPTKASS